jgi:hypothetical protein
MWRPAGLHSQARRGNQCSSIRWTCSYHITCSPSIRTFIGKLTAGKKPVPFW